MKMYVCPMDPDVVSNQPGKCPKCGMELTEIQNSEFRIQNEGRKRYGDKHVSMEEDFKKRFFITLPFVISAMALSPNIQEWFHVIIPGFL